MVTRPDYRAYLADRHILKISSAGKIMDMMLTGGNYARFSVSDALAVTWQLYTADQLVQLAQELTGQEG